MAKYRDRPFAWGKVDCAKVVAYHLKQLGYPIRISSIGSYTSALSAKRRLAAQGYANLGEMADGIGLTRIPYARMLLGDVVELEGDDPIGSLFLYAGNGNIFGFHELHPALVSLQPITILRAWSVL